MNENLFSGKAENYEKARPNYPQAAIDYIFSLLPQNAVIADVGAGTGKLTKSLCARACSVFAVEPNADMRAQLEKTLAKFPNAHAINGTAENTTLAPQSADAVTVAQALHWFEPKAFRAECHRVLKPDGIVISVYNSTPEKAVRQEYATFFINPTVRVFANPVYYSREEWLAFMTSHSHDPLPSSHDFSEHIEKMNAIFDQENVDGLLKQNFVTRVYSEKINYPY